MKRILLFATEDKSEIMAELRIIGNSLNENDEIMIKNKCFHVIPFNETIFMEVILKELDSGKYDDWFIHHSVPNAANLVSDIWRKTGYVFTVHGPLNEKTSECVIQ